MSEFLRYALWELRRYFVLVVLAGVIVVISVALLRRIHKRKYGQYQTIAWKWYVLLLTFWGYVLLVLFLTTFRSSSFHRQVNLHLFRAWREALNNFSAHRWLNVLLNIAMFVPFGFMLPMLREKFRKCYLTIPVGLAFSLFIEVVQLTLARGVFDVDDLFCNSLGATIGFFGVMTLLTLFQKREKRCRTILPHAGMLLILLGAVGSVFLCYHIQELGNLPQASAYRIDTKDTIWKLECELTGGSEMAAVYQTIMRSKDECDAFATDFQQRIPTILDDISYYQEAAYYMDHGSQGGAHFLFVHYLDQGFEYSAIYDEAALWGEGDRETIEKALEKYGISVPVSAEFAVLGEGWHSFFCCQQQEGDYFWDGILRVRYCENGSLREIENGLLSYSYYSQVEIIGAQGAYEQLIAGKFNDEGLFERVKPSQVAVLGWSMEYRVDTKGFYQPVYVFEVASQDGTYQSSIVIPAVK